jgi:hypothetical protein
MAPVEFEKELQKRLRSREVEPSPTSWDRIEAQLEADRPNGRQGSLKWKILAAASIVFLLGYFLLQEPAADLPVQDAVVESPVPITPEAPEIQDKSEEIIIPVIESPNGVAAMEAVANSPLPRKTPPDNSRAGVHSESAFQPVLTDRALEGFTPEIQEELRISDSGLMAAAVEQGRTDAINDAEVDALLLHAMEVADNNSAAARDTITMNAAMLLGEVEYELDQTFREQILRKMKTGFSKVRTAVADRSQ